MAELRIKVVNGIRTIKFHEPKEHRRTKVTLGTRELRANIEVTKKIKKKVTQRPAVTLDVNPLQNQLDLLNAKVHVGKLLKDAVVACNLL